MPLEITLNRQRYKLARGKQGEPLWGVTRRSSQPGDPGGVDVAEWRVDGHDFNSFELIRPGQSQGYLGRDFGINTDGRWIGLDTLGPQVNTITLSTYDQSWAASLVETATFKPGVNLHLGAPPDIDNANGVDVLPGPGGASYAYVIRGSTPAKVKLSDMTLANSGEQLQAPAKSVLTTRTASGVRELSIGMEGAPYRVLTQISAPPNLDNWATNDDNVVNAVLGIAPDRVVGMGEQTVRGNILSGAVTMASPNWSTVATIDGERLTFTGFAMDSGLWVVGTSDGPYMLDALTGNFFPIIREIDNNDLNCLQMSEWFPLGVVIPLSTGMRFQRNAQGASLGPETFQLNSSPVNGRPSAVTGGLRYLYTVEYNPTTGDSWLVAWHPREIGDGHANVLSPFVIHKFTAQVSLFLRHIGTVNGERTNPTLIGGLGSNAFYMTEGRTARHIDDSNHRYETAGTTYLTEMRRNPGVIKDFELVEFESDNCSATNTITPGFQIDGGSWNTLSGAIDHDDGATFNGAVNSDGLQRIALVDDGNAPHSWATGRRIKPRLAYAGSASSAPQVVGTLRLYYRWRPEMVRTFKFSIDLTDARAGDSTAKELEEALLEELTNGPVEVREDMDNDRYFTRVESVVVVELPRRDDEKDAPHGRKQAEVTMTEWRTKP